MGRGARPLNESLDMTSTKWHLALVAVLLIAGVCRAEDKVTIHYFSGFGDRSGIEDITISVAYKQGPLPESEAAAYFNAVSKILNESGIPNDWTAVMPLHSPIISLVAELGPKKYKLQLPLPSPRGIPKPDKLDNPKYFDAALQVLRLTVARAKRQFPVN